MDMKKLLPEGILREDRTAFLNERMRKVIPSICIERAKIVTESYKKDRRYTICFA